MYRPSSTIHASFGSDSAHPTPFLKQITRHIEQTIGTSPMVFHELVSTDIHLDLHIIPPHGKEPSAAHPFGRDFFTIVTSGLSTRPMTLPTDASEDLSRYAELMISLPAHWPGLHRDGTFDEARMHEEANWWPIRWLKAVARLPHERGTYLAPGHTIPNGDLAEPFAGNTRLGCMMVMPSALHPKSHRLTVHDDVTIEFLALWPLYPEEMAMKLREGAARLAEAMEQAGVTDLVDIARRPV